ncbi:LPS export ABC transporter periplasmic protein LptC [Aestuariibacter halophilus]|uniref:Lipopolysaccharide export system protein LptC n=1 Tax=Fluctibacter halophilus TaxID=226011 RepID=A0ABS8GBG6_9ALTE|nr:LPS export ABC transporter periplasmic protein LptC [Aestuariibacter halophilus]MCC2617848.1 LPS export ABC transporter periplasmic protein LptC [Aestuariibacter halophilus]
MNRLTVSIIILFLLVLGIYLQSWVSQKAPTAVQQTEEAWQPNYQARSMRSTLYDEQGKVSHEVFAQKMEHYQLLGFTLFQLPQYTIYVERQDQPWHVVAKEGTLYDDNRIQLETDVEIHSQTDDGFVRRIKTNFIEINLLDKTLYSDQPVEIIGRDFVINANGFSGNLATQTYEFIDHVQTRYAPN